jgi:acetyltransferase-like isoleucine patch superfamily enzyme
MDKSNTTLIAKYAITKTEARIGILYHSLHYSRVRGLFPVFKVVKCIYSSFNKKYGHAGNIDRFYFHYRFGLPVGKYTYGYEQFITTAKGIASIGSFCSLASNITITGINHPINFVTTHPFLFYSSRGFILEDRLELLDQNKNRKVIIEDDVWIGTNVTILPSVKICSGAIIGAGAVVTKDVPPYAIVAGNPAKVLKFRFGEKEIEKLLEIKWWVWPDEKIRENGRLFLEPHTFINMFRK